MDVTAMLRHHEGLTFEAKEAAAGLPRSVWETYAAFANTVGGVIVLGVQEGADGALVPVGVPDPDALVREFWNTVNNPTKVSANILTHANVAVMQVEDASLVVIAVPRAGVGQRPVYLNGRLDCAFRRRGEGDYRCTEAEARAMMRDSAPGGVDITVLEQLSLDAWAPESIEHYRRMLELAHPGHPWVNLSREELLMRLGAAGYAPGDDELHPTRAGLLLLGHEYQIVREFPEYFLDYREVGPEEPGDQRWSDRLVSSSGDWPGNLLEFWQRAYTKISLSLKRPFQMGEDGRRRDDTPLHAAVREALTNCLMHADYFGEGGVVILCAPNRLVFRNPGLMRIPPEVALQGGTSSARNARLTTMLNLIGLGERAGSGFDTMRRGCRWAGYPDPQLTELLGPDAVELSFEWRTRSLNYVVKDFRQVAERGGARECFMPEGEGRRFAATVAIDEAWGDLSPQEYQVAVYVRKYRRVRRTDVQRELGVGRSRAGEVLAQLVDKQVIEPVGKGRGRFYRLRPV